MTTEHFAKMSKNYYSSKYMIRNEEEYRNQPEVINFPEWQKAFYYILYVGNCADYDEGMAYITEKLRNPEESIQAGAIEAIGLLAERFYNIKEDLILPLLFENLKSTSEKILDKTLETLGDISRCILRLRRKICLAYFKNGFDYFSYKKLKIFTNKDLMHSLNNEEEKIEFILSFCQNSLNYQEALEVCLYFLKKNESRKINTTAFEGFTYIIVRFQKIDFKTVLPFIKKYLSYSMIGTRTSEWMAARYLLADIVIMIPKLRLKTMSLLKRDCTVYLRYPSFISYIMTKNKQKDQIKLEKMLKLYVNNLERAKIKYNLPDF